MLRGIYASACSLVAQMAREELLAANLANATTLGYRRLTAAVESFPDLLPAGNTAWPSRLRLGVTVAAPTVDLQQGPIEQTDNPLDLAICGEGFFTVADPSGKLFFTRAGRFLLDKNRRLITPGGYAAMGEKGEIRIPADTRRITVSADGMIYADGTAVDKLRLVAFDNPAALVPAGNNLYTAAAPGRPANPERVIQGAVEHSNVQPAQELAKMVAALRVYEANVRAISLQDQALAKLLQAIA